MRWFYQHNNLNNNNDNQKACDAHLGLLTRWGFHAKQPRKGDINGQRKAALPCQWCLPPLGQQHELLATAICMHTLHVHTSKTLCYRDRGATQRHNLVILQSPKEEECSLQFGFSLATQFQTLGDQRMQRAMLSQLTYMTKLSDALFCV